MNEELKVLYKEWLKVSSDEQAAATLAAAELTGQTLHWINNRLNELDGTIDSRLNNLEITLREK